MKHLCIPTVFAVLSFTSALAQNSKAHWGIQGDIARVNIPTSVIEKINALPERPDVNGTSYGFGLVRFHGNGAPSYALQFSKLDADFSGAQQQGSFRRDIAGSGSVQGFMVTKYVNVVAKKHVSAGFAFGGGIGKLEASYVRSTSFAGIAPALETNSYDRIVPLFEILGRIDVRPIKYLSIGPYYGIRNGTLAAGAALRLHITK
jgi:hypothetical protein